MGYILEATTGETKVKHFGLACIIMETKKMKIKALMRDNIIKHIFQTFD